MQTNLMKLIGFVLAMFCLSSLIAQENATQKDKEKKRFEIGLTHEIGNGYSLLLKKQLKENIFLRSKLKASIGGLGRDFLNPERISIFNVDLEASLGLEFHIPLNERLSIYHGPEISARYRHLEVGGSGYETKSIGVGYFAGVLYKVTKGFSIFAEVGNTFSFGHAQAWNNNSHRSSSGLQNIQTGFNIGASINLNGKKKKEKGKLRF